MSKTQTRDMRPKAQIEEFTVDRLSDVNMVKNEFVGGTNKRFCFGCIPCWCCPESDEDYKAYFRRNPAALKLGAVALNEDGRVIGAVQMHEYGIPQPFFDSLLHQIQPKEAYIAWMAVLDGNRGRGAGSGMLKWCQETARKRGNTRLTLGVVANNPAKRLCLLDDVIPRILASKNFFERLSIDPPRITKPAVVRKSYRTLALRCHPDKVSHTNAKEAFQLISEAFDSLHDPSKQQKYLATLRRAGGRKSRASTSKQRRHKPYASRQWYERSWEDVERELRRREKLETEFKKSRSEEWFKMSARRWLKRARMICRNLDDQIGIADNPLWQSIREREDACERGVRLDPYASLREKVESEIERRAKAAKEDPVEELRQTLLYLYEKHQYHDLDGDLASEGFALPLAGEGNADEDRQSASKVTESEKTHTAPALPWRCKVCHAGNAPNSRACGKCGTERASLC
eukprot:g1955.t1